MTHTEHLDWLREIFGDPSAESAGLQVGAVVLVPVATPAIVSSSSSSSSSSAALWSSAQQNACLAACLGGAHGGGVGFAGPVALVAFNLFALEVPRQYFT